MSKEKPSCDLCGLPVEIPGFDLETKEERKHFCCEGCQGIYQMLHEDEILRDDKES